ncbi:MAG: DUF6328 family protein [Pseudonocardia sp.]|nr:DUF6328 family protein [Pseudonocardia sp.]
MSDHVGTGSATQDERSESPNERADRNLLEMLQGLRVAQIGVQILFASLITVSFTARFARIDEVQRWVYTSTLLLAAVTTGLLVAPAAAHRVAFGRGVKPAVVRLGQRLFISGLVTLALTMAGAVELVLEIAVGRPFAITVAAVLGVAFLVLWFVVPRPLLRGQEGRVAE